MGSVFASLDTVRSWRRAFFGRPFLIPCGRASVNDQSKYTTGVKLTYFRLGAPSIAARLLEGFVLLDAGPYRLEGRMAKKWVYIAAGADEEVQSLG